MKRFGDPHRRTWASDHERARQRSAERLSLPLPAPEAAWLRSHLAVCPACARVATQYEAQRDELRELRAIDPPRDLWARTSTALDAVDREFARTALPASAARTSSRRRPTRSIRSIRAERHAWAAGRMRGPGVGRLGRGVPRTTGNARWAIPFAALAAFAIVVATGGGVLLTVGLPTGPVPSGGTPLTADGTRPAATPITIDAAQVVWLSPNQSGGYSLNVAQVDQVCPDEARQDCAPIEQGEAQALPAFSAQPGAVVRSPSHSQLVVVDRAARSGGGNVYVVAMPAVVDPPDPTPLPSIEPTMAATVTPEPTAEPTPISTPDPTPASSSESSPEPSPEPSASVEPAASPEPTAEPTVEASIEPSLTLEPSPTATAAAIAIISDVILVGESAAYSADGSMFAFSARPSDGSHGPDIYLWRVGDSAAQPVTADHGSIFSGWAGNLILGSRAIATATPQATPAPDPSASPAAEATAPAESGQPAEPSADGSTSGWAAEAAVALEAFSSPDPGISSSRHLPAAIEASPAASFEPSADPSSAGSPAASADGSMAPSGDPSADPLAGASGAPSDAPSASPESTDTAVPVSFLFDPATRTETSLAATPAWRPVVDPSGGFVVFWSGALRYDAEALAWVPAAGQLFLAAWPAFSSPDVVEVPAVPLLEGDPDGAPTGAWDARWDSDGDHLAVWVADASDPSIGRLNLLAIDASAATLGPPMLLLQDEPALPGFSIGEDRLVWATPPGQDGEGSRLQVLAWSGEHAGQIVSEPATGDNAVIVVQ